MKKLSLFILALLSSTFIARACGFYPYADELRYCFFKPEYYGYELFSEFNYTANYFEPNALYERGKNTPNEEFWYHYCNGKVSTTSVTEAVYEIRQQDFNENSSNAMVKYLFAKRDSEAISYLKFAKICESLNSFYDDPWERNEYAKLPQIAKHIKKSLANAAKVKNQDVKLRYAFLAIRMAFYNQDKALVKKIYDDFFANVQNKDMVYYWSLHFRALGEIDKPLAFFYAAQVFSNSPDKRFAIYNNIDSKFSLADVLKYASTAKERANVYLMAGIHKPDRAIEMLEGMYKNDPGAEGLAFLLLREVNKIEDWVHTPYYSLFAPSVQNGYNDYEEASLNNVLKRVKKDRIYAVKVLQFVKSVNERKVYNSHFWKLAQTQLEFITQDYKNALKTIEAIEKGFDKNDLAYNELQMIKALALTALQQYGKAFIPDEVKNIILKNKNDQKFLFAFGRELEYKGNTNDAALMYSMLSERADREYSEGRYVNAAYWKTAKNDGDNYHDFYTDYFGYINGYYTPEQLAGVIKAIENNKESDSFSLWKYSVLKNRLDELYDLLGTKYIRQNKLPAALPCFKKVAKTYVNGNLAMWERTEDYWNVFDKNPFYQIKYTPDFIPVKDNIKLNKYTVTKQLINYLARADNPKEKDRDYYYFLVANCYYNMTARGNSWMMRRYYWTSAYTTTVVEDEKEYNEALLAQKYYKLALKYAKNEKFKALCLRMQGFCEGNVYNDWYLRDKFNPLDYEGYAKLKKEYPAYYDELSNCTAFADYFKARR